jgi:prophage regulatory protein
MRLLDHDGLTAKGVKPESKTQRWRLIKVGAFPKPIKCGARNCWLESEIDSWIAERVAERDGRPVEAA